MLASINFISSSMHNSQARIYRRETFLHEVEMRATGLGCGNCGREIARGAKFAITPSLTRLCTDCYAEMPEPLARATVRFESIQCMRVRRHVYREICLYDFGQVTVAFQPDGRELRFVDLSAARTWVDQNWSLGLVGTI